MDECNKEEAQRAKQIAEKKFTLKDLKSAKKFALKSEKLFPSLEISQLISTLDVYLSSENRYGEDPDWYGILGLSPFSDEDLVKKQYRKLALQLHPDKNKSIGAEGAFKLISEAWSILSDTNNKNIYDQKRKSFTTNNNNNINNNNNNDNSNSNNNNGVVSGSSGKINRRNKNKNKKQNGSGTIRTGVDTFWTSCNRCRMQYEYLRIYLNHNLLCPNCHNAFMAVETGFPSNGNNNTNSNLKNNSNSNLSYSGSKSNNSGYSASKNNNSGYENSSSFTWETQPAKVNKGNNNNNRRKHEDTKMYEYNYDYNNYGSNNNNATSNYNFNYSSGGSANVQFNNNEKIAKKPGRPPKRRKYTYGETSYNTNINANINIVERPITDLENLNGFAQMANNSTIINNNNYGVNYVNNSSSRMPYKRNSFRDLSQADIRAILMEKAKEKISKKLSEFNISSSKKHQSIIQEDIQNDHFTPLNDARKIVKVMGQPASITVPDPDFYDFDQDRTDKKFDSDQVWATYDSEDGMPRLYAIIQKITKKPFSIKMSFLNSKSNSELGPINWVGSGFTKTLGDFRVGRYQITDTVNIFSHRVQFEKGPRGIVKILPKKGETWAVYKNWASDWNELTPDEIIYKYEIVEIITDFDENLGFLEVLPMVKVAGFKAVFYRHMDPEEVRKIPKEEMFRFSHGIPNKLLLGNEGQNGQNAPKGCVELDPAATPVELLQIIN